MPMPGMGFYTPPASFATVAPAAGSFATVAPSAGSFATVAPAGTSFGTVASAGASFATVAPAMSSFAMAAQPQAGPGVVNARRPPLSPIGEAAVRHRAVEPVACRSGARGAEHVELGGQSAGEPRILRAGSTLATARKEIK